MNIIPFGPHFGRFVASLQRKRRHSETFENSRDLCFHIQTPPIFFLTVEVAQILWQMFMPDHFTQLSHKSDFFQLFVFCFYYNSNAVWPFWHCFCRPLSGIFWDTFFFKLRFLTCTFTFRHFMRFMRLPPTYRSHDPLLQGNVQTLETQVVREASRTVRASLAQVGGEANSGRSWSGDLDGCYVFFSFKWLGEEERCAIHAGISKADLRFIKLLIIHPLIWSQFFVRLSLFLFKHPIIMATRHPWNPCISSSRS